MKATYDLTCPKCGGHVHRCDCHSGSTMRLLAVGVCVAALCLTACSDFPRPLAPLHDDYNSDTAELSWLALDAIDTSQTIQIARHPKCYREADPMAARMYGSDHPNVGTVVALNLALAFGHSVVTSWLDDKVATHEMANDGSVGPWYVGRIIWHVVGIVGTGAAVAGNFGIGLTPMGARGC